MEPAAATQALVADIKTGLFEPAQPADRIPAAPTASPRPIRPRLLLQDVTTHAVDADKVHLVVGFRQHVIASLVRFREWQVTDAPAMSAANAAGSYELQITAHQDGQAVHLLLMLKELEANLYIWSDGFELRLENWFDSQRRVVRRVAMALNVHLSAERLARFSEHPDVSLGIYDRWLRCQTQVRTFSAQYWERAAVQFPDIIAAAPNFVPAYCGLANLQNIRHISYPGVFRSREAERTALDLGRRAVQLDPSDTGAQRCLAWAHAMAKQYAQAETHIELACELNPNDSWTLISAALLLVFCGRPERGMALAGPALDVAVAPPTRSHWAYQFDIQFLTGDYEGALSTSERAQDVLEFTRSAWRVAALANLGHAGQAAEEADRFLAGIRANWFGAAPATDAAIVRWLLHL
jgi:tetratricopeptide (TPR) repeat protein